MKRNLKLGNMFKEDKLYVTACTLLYCDPHNSTRTTGVRERVMY